MGLISLLKQTFGARARHQERAETRVALAATLLPHLPMSQILELTRGGEPLGELKEALRDRAWRRSLLSALSDERLEQLAKDWRAAGGYEEEAWRLMESSSEASMWREDLISSYLDSAWLKARLEPYRASGAPEALLRAPLLYMPSYSELLQARASLERSDAPDKSPIALRLQALDLYLERDCEGFAERAAHLAQHAPITGGLFEAVAAWVSAHQAGDDEALTEAMRYSSLLSLRRVSASAPFNLFLRQLSLSLERALLELHHELPPALRGITSARGLWERVTPFDAALVTRPHELTSDEHTSDEHTSSALDQLNAQGAAHLAPSVSATDEPSPLASSPLSEVSVPVAPAALAPASDALSALDQLNKPAPLNAPVEAEPSLEAPTTTEQTSHVSPEELFAPIQTLLPSELLDESDAIEEPTLSAQEAPAQPAFNAQEALMWATPLASSPRPHLPALPRLTFKGALKPLLKLSYRGRERFVCLNIVSALNPSPRYPLPTGPVNPQQLQGWLYEHGVPLERSALVRLLGLAGLRLPDEWEVRALSEHAPLLGDAWTRSQALMVWSFERREWALPRRAVRVIGCAISHELVEEDEHLEVVDGDELISLSVQELLDQLLSPLEGADELEGAIKPSPEPTPIPKQPAFNRSEALTWAEPQEPSLLDAPPAHDELEEPLPQMGEPLALSTFTTGVAIVNRGHETNLYTGCALSARRAATEPYPQPTLCYDPSAWVKAYGVPQERKSAKALLLSMGQRLPQRWEVIELARAGFISSDCVVWTSDERELPYDLAQQTGVSSRAAGARLTLVGFPLQDQPSAEDLEALPHTSTLALELEPALEVNAEPEAALEVNAEPEAALEVNAELEPALEVNAELEPALEVNAELEPALEVNAEFTPVFDENPELNQQVSALFSDLSHELLTGAEMMHQTAHEVELTQEPSSAEPSDLTELSPPVHSPLEMSDVSPSPVGEQAGEVEPVEEDTPLNQEGSLESLLAELEDEPTPVELTPPQSVAPEMIPFELEDEPENNAALNELELGSDELSDLFNAALSELSETSPLEPAPEPFALQPEPAPEPFALQPEPAPEPFALQPEPEPEPFALQPEPAPEPFAPQRTPPPPPPPHTPSWPRSASSPRQVASSSLAPQTPTSIGPQTVMGMSVPEMLLNAAPEPTLEPAPKPTPEPADASTRTPLSPSHELLRVVPLHELTQALELISDDASRGFFELLLTEESVHVTQVVERVGGSSLSVSLKRNYLNRLLAEAGVPLMVHSEFRPKQGDQPLGIYYSLTKANL